MNSIREALVALDTNQYLFAVRRDLRYPDCERLMFDRIGELDILVPLQVQVELKRNLRTPQVQGVFRALHRARSVTFDFERVTAVRILEWEARGAKKGDAVIAACLQRTGVSYFISENRHFLRELSDLPFRVVSSAEAVRLLDEIP